MFGDFQISTFFQNAFLSLSQINKTSESMEEIDEQLQQVLNLINPQNAPSMNERFSTTRSLLLFSRKN